MSQKRGASFNHYEDNRGKKPKQASSQNPNLTPLHGGRRNPNSHGNSYGGRPQHGPPSWSKNRENPAIEHIDRLPDPSKCEPCKLAAAEALAGTIALLDKLEAEELTPNGDRDVLHHARELRRLLSARADKKHAQLKKALDEKRPAQDNHVIVPAYIEQKLELAKDLPPLPPITEPYLQEAVFTHITAHGNFTKGVDDGDKITYERLEFLGDAYIELIASRLIYSRLPHVNVPQQAHFREQLVKNETLGRFSTAYALPDRLKHGGHLSNSAGWNKIVADVFEAYVAAVVLSDPQDGFQTAEKWLTVLWTPQMLNYKEEVIENPRAKDDLQRLVFGKDVTLSYREERDMVHENGVQKFFIGLYLTGWGFEDEWLGSGEGRNKAQANVYAAMDALKRNNTVLRTASKKKAEMAQARKEQQQKHKEMDDQDKGKIEPNSEENAKQLTNMDDHKNVQTSEPKTNTWLAKEKKNKEKKERRERKVKERMEAARGSP